MLGQLFNFLQVRLYHLHLHIHLLSLYFLHALVLLKLQRVLAVVNLRSLHERCLIEVLSPLRKFLPLLFQTLFELTAPLRPLHQVILSVGLLVVLDSALGLNH